MRKTKAIRNKIALQNVEDRLWERHVKEAKQKKRKVIKALAGIGYTLAEVRDVAKCMLAMHVDEIQALHDCPISTVLEKTLCRVVMVSLQASKIDAVSGLIELAFGKASIVEMDESQFKEIKPMVVADAMEASRVYIEHMGKI